MIVLYFLIGLLIVFYCLVCGFKENDSYDIIYLDFLDYIGDLNFCVLKLGEKDESIEVDLYENYFLWYYEVFWVLYIFVFNSIFVCMVVYFVFFFDECFFYVWIFYIFRYFFYVFLMIVDILVSYIFVRLLYVVYVYIFGVVYVMFIFVFILMEVKVDLCLNFSMYFLLEFGDELLIYIVYLLIFLIVGFV